MKWKITAIYHRVALEPAWPVQNRSSNTTYSDTPIVTDV